MEYQTINTHRADLDINYLKEISLLYQGGNTLTRHADCFVQILQGENYKSYRERLSLLSYKNFFGQIIDSITSKLFEDNIKILSTNNFFKNLQKENNLNRILRAITTNNLIYGESYLLIDFPEYDEKTEYEVEKDNLNIPCLKILENQTVINYVKDDDDNFLELIVKTLCDDKKISALVKERFYFKFEYYVLENNRVKITTYETNRFKLIEHESNKGQWQNQQTQVSPSIPIIYGTKSYQNIPDKKLQIISEKEVILNIPKIPVISLKFGNGLNVGYKLAPIAKEILQDGSALRSFYHKTINPLVVIKHAGMGEKEEINDAFGSVDRNRNPLDSYKSKGFSMITDGDDIIYLEPRGQVADQVAKHVDKLCDQMYHLSWQTISADNKHSSPKSGVSKSLDEKQKDIIISSIATEIKQYLSNVICNIIEFLAEPKIEYEIVGLDFSSDAISREDMISDALNIEKLQIFQLSRTFRTVWGSNLADKVLMGMSSIEVSKQIAKEIELGSVNPLEAEKEESKSGAMNED